jgi:hypothetical protein
MQVAGHHAALLERWWMAGVLLGERVGINWTTRGVARYVGSAANGPPPARVSAGSAAVSTRRGFAFRSVGQGIV